MNNFDWFCQNYSHKQDYGSHKSEFFNKFFRFYHEFFEWMFGGSVVDDESYFCIQNNDGFHEN